MALSALAQPQLDDDEADDYRLHEVWLHDFKSYAGAVRVGPFHPRRCRTIAVSHRPPMVEAACTLVGAYARPGASGSASLRFG